jgi:hypothetical protein
MAPFSSSVSSFFIISPPIIERQRLSVPFTNTSNSHLLKKRKKEKRRGGLDASLLSMFKAKFEVLFVNGAIGYGAVTTKKLLYHVSNPISLVGPIAHLF